MDEQVIRSLIKWPSVPECYGWLGLDQRGQWRMRNEYAQAHQLPGDIIRHEGLIDFIHRNYGRDSQGQWFFQNGPQRVFIDLDYTPFIARMDDAIIKTHSDDVIEPQACLMDETGRMLLNCQVEIQVANDNLFTTTVEPMTLLIHDHDLERFSRTAQLNNICGALGTWEWQGKVFEIEGVDSREIKNRYCLRPSSRNS